jgi:hypothetical protein
MWILGGPADARHAESRVRGVSIPSSRWRAKWEKAHINVTGERCAWIPELVQLLASLSRGGATAERPGRWWSCMPPIVLPRGYGGSRDAGKPGMSGEGRLSSGGHGVACTGEIWEKCRIPAG